MIEQKKNHSVLLVDDDEDYYYLAKEAFEEAGIGELLSWVKGGEELFQFLTTRRPGIILLDLNMPKMDGFQVLEKLKASVDYRRVPVVILTTSRSDADASRSYDLGASSFISKPIDFLRLVDFIKTFSKYWMQIAELPSR